MKYLLNKIVFGFLAFTTAATAARASEYPGDMQVFSDCQYQGPVELCRGMQYSGAIVLEIRYTGALNNSGNLSAYVRLKNWDASREGLFPMVAANGGDFEMGRITNGCLVGMLGGCAAQGTDEMKSLLQWAGRAPMIANALDLEVAFVSSTGAWDSRFGQNYVFRFEERAAD